MPFKQLVTDESWGRKARRVLLTGPPNSGKTTSLLTFPRPLAYVAFPNEDGASSMPTNIEDVKAWTYDKKDFTKDDYSETLKEVKQLCFDLLAGKHGEFRTFAFDGLHKLYSLFLAVQTSGDSERGEEFDAKEYGKTHKAFFKFLAQIKASPGENIVFTVWDGREKDDPEAKGKDAVTHIFPELPGAAAKLIMGEFSVVLYATKIGSGEGALYKWLTRPLGKVWGCGIKAPMELTTKIPTTLDAQDWRKLEPLLLGQAVQPLKKEVSK
jgi:hypothetical protein